MTYVWDTNILLQVLRSQDFYDMLNQQYDFTNPLNEVCISIVSVGEINAIALRNRWGTARLSYLSATLQTLKTVFIDDDPLLLQMYSENGCVQSKKTSCISIIHYGSQNGQK
jgi:predicted nucleic acid-binding protein